MNKVFPFSLQFQDAMALFRSYVKVNQATLTETYGHMGWGHDKHWSYYEVDAELLSETLVVFTTYGMENPVLGGRGEKQEQIRVVYDASALTTFVINRKQEMARLEYVDRERRRASAEKQAAIAKIYAELFPDDKT